MRAATAAGAGPASTRRFVAGSTRRFSPSSDLAPSRTRSPGSPNTTSSPVQIPETKTLTAPVQRLRTVPSTQRTPVLDRDAIEKGSPNHFIVSRESRKGAERRPFLPCQASSPNL